MDKINGTTAQMRTDPGQGCGGLLLRCPAQLPGKEPGGATFSAGCSMLAAKQTPHVIFRVLFFFVKAKVLFGFLLVDKQVPI